MSSRPLPDGWRHVDPVYRPDDGRDGILYGASRLVLLRKGAAELWHVGRYSLRVEGRMRWKAGYALWTNNAALPYAQQCQETLFEGRIAQHKLYEALARLRALFQEARLARGMVRRDKTLIIP